MLSSMEVLAREDVQESRQWSSRIRNGLALHIGKPVGRSRKRDLPVERGALPFLIKRDGTWLYRGTPIGRKELVHLFASVLTREEDGSFWLETPAERARIEVEDAPFVVVELDRMGDDSMQILSFRTNIDQVITAGPEHPLRVSHHVSTFEPTLYLHIRPGKGAKAIEARVNRAVCYELIALAIPQWVNGQRMLGVWSSGAFFPFQPSRATSDDADEDTASIEAVAQHFAEVSRNTVNTADRLLECARKDSEEIASLNRSIHARLAEINA